MNDMVNTALERIQEAGDLTVFNPFEARVKLAGLTGDILKWRLLKDWPEVEKAVDQKIAEQAAFVSNWDATVRRAGRGDRKLIPEGHYFTRAEAEKAWGFSQPTVSHWRTDLKNATAYRERLITGSFRLARMFPEDNHRAMGTGENEWFTPPRYIQAARAVMGGIDLDPASHEIAQEVVQAARYFTREDDGLAQAWDGRVWLNPPYARDEIEPFVGKLLEEIGTGRVSEAIMLTHNYTDTAWFQKAATVASLICFTKGRVRFTDIDGKAASPTQGQAFFYYGDNTSSFHEVFGEYGFIALTT